MKKIFFTIITILLMTAGSSFAADNFLNSVILEGSANNNYNVILRTDAIAAAKRTVESSDKIVLNIKGLTASDDISTMYRNTSSANGIIVENIGNNEVKIQIQAKNISKANIMFDSPATAPIVVSDGISHKAIGWTIFALFILCLLFVKAKTLKVDSKEKIRAAVQKNIRDREIAMYKNYRKEFLVKPSIDYKVTNPRIQQAIRRADTIRHLQRYSKV
jgi:hypothetical protein